MRSWILVLAVLHAVVASCGPSLPTCNPGVPPPCLLACNDRMKNGDETDVDCGGHCAPCMNGATCASAVDCESASCVNASCAAPTCADQIMNGLETDVDCGRHSPRDAGGVPDAALCPRCVPGQVCVLGDDCRSGLCAASTCTPSLCMDSKKDGSETDADCGGLYCPTCTAGKACLVGADCESGTCANNVCK